MSMLAATLCVFVRAPNLGQVKSRLAASVGEPAALAGHIRLVEHLLDQLDTTNTNRSNRFAIQLWLADEPATPVARRQVERWVGRTGQGIQKQHGVDLGERMAGALATCVASGGIGVLVGSDCPTIDSNYVKQALTALANGADVVLGPAEDGGYGLVAVTQDHPVLFQGISWGTDQVLRQTLAKAQQQSLVVHLLDSLWDVDYLVDWRRFCEAYGEG
jgi:rSAM/selenodomain-associated transferase 1